MPCQNGEWAASACSIGRSARIRLQARIVVSGSGIPTWMCSAQRRRAAQQPAHLVADLGVALGHDVRRRRRTAPAGWMPAPIGVPPLARTSARSASSVRVPSIASWLISDADSTSAS